MCRNLLPVRKNRAIPNPQQKSLRTLTEELSEVLHRSNVTCCRFAQYRGYQRFLRAVQALQCKCAVPDGKPGDRCQNKKCSLLIGVRYERS